MLPLATAHIAKPIYANSLIRFALSISMPRFKSIIFNQNSPKICEKNNLFVKKNAKFSSAGSYALRPLCLRRLGASPPDHHTHPPIANFWPRTCQLCTICNYTRSCSFCFQQFFLDRSVANLMMLNADVCLMLDGFLVEKFYLHYALCDIAFIL